MWTQIPNELLDEYLPDLPSGELKVLLTILRLTVGFSNNGIRIRRAWIARSVLVMRTGLSAKHVSRVTANLYQKGLIIITNENGKPLSTSLERKNESKLFYRCTLVSGAPNVPGAGTSMRHDQGHQGPSIKETPIKEIKKEKKFISATSGLKHISKVIEKTPWTSQPKM